MKKVICLLLACLMAFGCLAGCSGDKATEEPSGSTGTTNTNTDTESTDTETSDTDSTDEAPAADGSSAASGTFNIGVIGPLTGGAAIYGTAVANAAQLAADEINAMGGIQFNVMTEDDANVAETSVNAYNTLKDQGMQILLGTVTTTPCIAVASETNTDRIFTLTPSASSTDVLAGKDNVFQVCFTDPNQGLKSAQYIAENDLGTNIGIIYKNDDAYSTGIYESFVAESEAQGLNIAYTGVFQEATQTDFSVQLTEAQAADVDLLFLPIYYTPASVILRQASDMGFAPTFFGVDGMDGILTVEGFDTSLAEGVMLLTPFSAYSDDEASQAFTEKYQEQFGELPNQFAADAYDGMYILKAAIEQAGVTADMSAEEICEALLAVMPELSVTGLTSGGGEMTWQATGEVDKEPLAAVIEDGVYVMMG